MSCNPVVKFRGPIIISGAIGSGGVGAAYVFEPSGGNWAQTVKLTPDDGAAGDVFGLSSDIEGETIFVGSRNDPLGVESGSAVDISDPFSVRCCRA